MTYDPEARALDREILNLISRWHSIGADIDDRYFNDLALRVFAHQLRYNEPYARYAASFGVTLSALPATWNDIPAVPSAAYKETVLATFDVSRAALAFQTSGTTQGIAGRHYMENAALYDAALLATFDRFVLAGRPPLRYCNLVPNPSERPQSSLGYMMATIAGRRGLGDTGWYVRDDSLLADAFFADLAAAAAQRQPVCIASTAFALADAMGAMQARAVCFALPAGSCIMETGGFKGHTRSVSREEFYDAICARFGVSRADIVSEYGMTELTSQYYDVCESAQGARFKHGPPWLRTRVTGAAGETLPRGTAGALVHVDLANRSSCVAVQTEDLGALYDRGLVLAGRDADAALRGCSLDAETLRRR
ncbi:MAG: hypothetical protein M3R51_00700 [Candidatus Eremiobacteraeota bacterium]|nr:hypothetical protein [Candidatus Eremiobacteraeota bacterium]